MLESGWNASVKTYYADVKVGQNVDPFSKSVVGGRWSVVVVVVKAVERSGDEDSCSHL